METYQVFEFGKKDDKIGDHFGVFALNIAEMNDISIWQPERVIERYAAKMLTEKVANEMDPNLIIIRLGAI